MKKSLDILCNFPFTKVGGVLGLVLVLSLVSCGKRMIYSEFQPIPSSGWEADSAVSFTVNVTDTLTPYDICLHLRHTQQYPFQNLWLFVENTTPTETQIDTLEFFVADQRGKWLGSGWGNLRELALPYKQTVVFPTAGAYTFRIQQGMRDECLRGINDIGLTIESNDK